MSGEIISTFLCFRAKMAQLTFPLSFFDNILKVVSKPNQNIGLVVIGEGKSKDNEYIYLPMEAGAIVSAVGC